MTKLVVHCLEPIKIDKNHGTPQSVVSRIYGPIDEFDGGGPVVARRQVVDRGSDLELLMEKRPIGHITETPHGATDDTPDIGERAKTKKAYAVLHGDRRGSTGRHSKSDLDAVDRATCERLGEGFRKSWSVLARHGGHLSVE